MVLEGKLFNFIYCLIGEYVKFFNLYFVYEGECFILIKGLIYKMFNFMFEWMVFFYVYLFFLEDMMVFEE